MKKVNLTVELQDLDECMLFERWIKGHTEVTDFQILKDTKELYQKDKHFKDICKKLKAIKKFRDKYINEHNY